MSDRVIFHSDANSFYASVECLYDPEIRDKPVAVCGDPAARHGIVLTANGIAKKYGVRTGSPIWQAQRLCPGLVTVRPDYSLYLHFSQMLRSLYEEYTDHVEAFGLDECWLDMTQPGLTLEGAVGLADELRRRVREEMGITVSVGVSYNKVFAKLASDLKKPDATTLITPGNYRERVWPLPVESLLFVGPRTKRKLKDFGIATIGDLAGADEAALERRLGRNGVTLRAFARGEDSSRVLRSDREAGVKSIGNSTTTPRDIADFEDAKCVFYLLAEGVGARLREQGFRCGRVSISVRLVNLETFSCQKMLPRATNLTDEIARAAMELFAAGFADKLPLRSAGLTCSALTPEREPVQMDLMGMELDSMRREKLERALDGLRKRYGHQVVQRGVVLQDKDFAAVNPKEENTVNFKPFHW
jgi:DNA polymerase-4